MAPASDPLLRLAALLRPPPAAPDARRRRSPTRWRLANRDAERLLAMTAERAARPCAHPPAAPATRPLPARRASATRDLVRLAAAERAGDRRGARRRAGRGRRLAAQAPAVDGDDILALGVPAGPRVGALLAALEAWWVAHDFAPDRAACLAEARRLVASGRFDQEAIARPAKS